MSVALILDTDIGSDVDDALALAFALRHPGIDLRAVTTVADDTVVRAHIAAELVRIAGHDDVEVAPGVGWSHPPSGRRSWFGHEGEGILESGVGSRSFDRDGVSLLLEETKARDVEIATVGMQSNIAAALDRDPAFASRVARLDVMGGVFAPVRIAGHELGAAADHNLMVDPSGSIKALNACIPTMYVPLDVTVHARLRRTHLDRLRAGDEVCQTLARLIDIWVRVSKFDGDTVAVLHDPLAVACAVDRRFVATETIPSPSRCTTMSCARSSTAWTECPPRSSRPWTDRPSPTSGSRPCLVDPYSGSRPPTFSVIAAQA